MITGFQFEIIIAAIFFITLLFNIGSKKISSFGVLLSICLCLFVVIAAVYSPVGFDKLVYTSLFSAPLNTDFRDIGWAYLTSFCYWLFNGNADYYFGFLALIYLSGFWTLGHKVCGYKYLWYYLLFSFLCIGFYSGLTNILRAGIATSLCFSAFAERKKYFFALIIAAIALTIHKSAILFVFAFLATLKYNNAKIYLCIWVGALLLSSVNAASAFTDFVVNYFGEADKRIGGYLNPEDTTADGTYMKAGFRIDFLIYSFYPIAIAWYYSIKRKFEDPVYTQIFCMYLLLNAIWICFIRVPYADRFSLFSWNLIPILLMYPYFNSHWRLSKPFFIISLLPPAATTLYLYLR